VYVSRSLGAANAKRKHHPPTALPRPGGNATAFGWLDGPKPSILLRSPQRAGTGSASPVRTVRPVRRGAPGSGKDPAREVLYCVEDDAPAIPWQVIPLR